MVERGRIDTKTYTHPNAELFIYDLKPTGRGIFSGNICGYFSSLKF